MKKARTVRIGCASALMGDTRTAAAQLLRGGEVRYLAFDYLADATIALMAAEHARDKSEGYAAEFDSALAPLLPELAKKGVRVVANAGGVNALACKKAIEAAVAKAGVALKVAAVLGDDLLPRQKEFADLRDTDAGRPMPAALVSMHAYLGAIPIAEALARGADIVITGRCADSALVLAPLMHEFGWKDTDHDKLAAGALAGHLLAGGTQCTGGNFTDWELVRSGYSDLGWPIAECEADGGLIITKPDGTGGLVSVHTVLEQMICEIGDPRAYVLPDVVVDLTQVKLEQAGQNRVRVSGARGAPPTSTYKVNATYRSGRRCVAAFIISGLDAAKKARASASALIERVRRQLTERKLGDFTGVDIHCIGAEDIYGPHARQAAQSTREAAVRIAVDHPDPKALNLFAREVAHTIAMAPGFTGDFGTGVPDPGLVARPFSTLVPKDKVPIEIVVGDARFGLKVPTAGGFKPLPAAVEEAGPPPVLEGTIIQVPLHRLALARSGGKGDHANIGVIARKRIYLPYLRKVLTPNAVREYFAHVLFGGEHGRVERWELPGTMSFNFLLYNALGGGGMASLRADPQGRAFGQVLLDFPVTIPALLAASI